MFPDLLFFWSRCAWERAVGFVHGLSQAAAGTVLQLWGCKHNKGGFALNDQT